VITMTGLQFISSLVTRRFGETQGSFLLETNTFRFLLKAVGFVKKLYINAFEKRLMNVFQIGRQICSFQSFPFMLHLNCYKSNFIVSNILEGV